MTDTTEAIPRQRECTHCTVMRTWLKPAREVDPDWPFEGALLLTPDRRNNRQFPDEEIAACECRCHDIWRAVNLGDWRDPLS